MVDRKLLSIAFARGWNQNSEQPLPPSHVIDIALASCKTEAEAEAQGFNLTRLWFDLDLDQNELG